MYFPSYTPYVKKIFPQFPMTTTSISQHNQVAIKITKNKRALIKKDIMKHVWWIAKLKGLYHELQNIWIHQNAQCRFMAILGK